MIPGVRPASRGSRYVVEHRQTSSYVPASRNNVRLHSKATRHARQAAGKPGARRWLVLRIVRVGRQNDRPKRISRRRVQVMQLLLGPDLTWKRRFQGGSARTQLAGITSLLDVYRSILQADPSARLPHFDSSLSEQAAGTLEAELAAYY